MKHLISASITEVYFTVQHFHRRLQMERLSVQTIEQASGPSACLPKEVRERLQDLSVYEREREDARPDFGRRGRSPVAAGNEVPPNLRQLDGLGTDCSKDPLVRPKVEYRQILVRLRRT